MNNTSLKVITRFPPSPTGNLHIGNIRTLLFNYLFTRQSGGEIVMRFEDTDTLRSSKEYEENALQTLEALGLDFDSGPFRQSERTEKYVNALEKLIKNGLAYIAEESTEEKGSKVIRFKNPNKKISFTDLIRGEITIDTTDFGDFIIARSKTSPIYHLTVVVDDLDMGITHVIRGEDHITSTPRQILLIEALGGVVPTYAHLPLIIGNDKKKLGKRHGAVTYQEFSELGYIPAGIINYLALLGWNPGDDREFFTKDELIKEFSLERVNNSPATFSYEKFDSINKHHILKLEHSDYLDYVRNFLSIDGNKDAEKIINHPNFSLLVENVIRERINKFSEVTEMLKNGEFNWLIETPTYETKELLWKEAQNSEIFSHIAHILSELTSITEWSSNNLRNKIWPYAEEVGKGVVLYPLRFALTGEKKSPDPFNVSAILGKEETTKRLNYALKLLQQN